MIVIDGSMGEGGGQIVRSSLSLSLLTGKPVRIEHVRAKRSKPGLLRQHLTAVKAAAAISNSRIEGAEMGSDTVTIEPGETKGGEYHFRVGTAGSCMLILQTLLPPLLRADKPSTIHLEGGTHNPMAPPFDFIKEIFTPLLTRMGAGLECRLDSHGFYPAGGGQARFTITPTQDLKPLVLEERGDLVDKMAASLVSALPKSIAKRELDTCGELLEIPQVQRITQVIKQPRGPGNMLSLKLKFQHLSAMFCGFGAKGLSSERVAKAVAEEAQEFLANPVTVCPHLADQLLIPLAMAGSGSFICGPPTPHATTNAHVIQQFLDVPIRFTRQKGRTYRLQVG